SSRHYRSGQHRVWTEEAGVAYVTHLCTLLHARAAGGKRGKRRISDFGCRISGGLCSDPKLTAIRNSPDIRHPTSEILLSMKITATIITLNEERNIARAIESLRCCDQIVVLDSGSVDRTAELASNLGARVVEHTWHGYANQKNSAAAQAEHDWILS